MKSFLSATYQGDGKEIMVMSGQSYLIEVQQALFGRILVRVVHSTTYKPFEGYRAVYPSLLHFFIAWNIKEFMGGSAWQTRLN